MRKTRLNAKDSRVFLSYQRHTALKATRGSRKTRAAAVHTADIEEPPRLSSLRGLLGVTIPQTVDAAQCRAVGRFSILRHAVGCRSPPLLILAFVKIRKRRKNNVKETEI